MSELNQDLVLDETHNVTFIHNYHSHLKNLHGWHVR